MWPITPERLPARRLAVNSLARSAQGTRSLPSAEAPRALRLKISGLVESYHPLSYGGCAPGLRLLWPPRWVGQVVRERLSVHCLSVACGANGPGEAQPICEHPPDAEPVCAPTWHRNWSGPPPPLNSRLFPFASSAIAILFELSSKATDACARDVGAAGRRNWRSVDQYSAPALQLAIGQARKKSR
jgi:hypothetical protein